MLCEVSICAQTIEPTVFENINVPDNLGNPSLHTPNYTCLYFSSQYQTRNLSVKVGIGVFRTLVTYNPNSNSPKRREQVHVTSPSIPEVGP